MKRTIFINLLLMPVALSCSVNDFESGGKYLVHCNFGWGGKCNGYFSVSCIDPYGKNADNYGISEEKKSKSGAYTWHFRVIKYKPDSLFTVNFKFD